MRITILLLFLTAAMYGQETNITLNASLAEIKINKHIYGHFAEHLGRCIYDGIYVGNNSTTPNTNGVRNDIIQALKDLKVPNLRWPGGCFADTYQWKDGIGPKAQRPKMINVWWGGSTEDNSFGTHEFLNLCEEIGTEPYLAGNVGSGSVKDLVDWVTYVNHPGGSPMSDLRIKNGRAKPWKVNMWGVGNEAWGCGGNMTPEYYANIYRQYATFMTDWGNSSGIFRIASGASDGEYLWTETLMKNIPHNMLAGVALHHYSVISWSDKGSDVAFSEAQYFKTMEEAWKMEEYITRHSTIMDKYDPEKKVALIVDEWGGWYNEVPNSSALFQQNTMRDAVLAGLTLNIFHNHADRVRGANLAQIVNVLQSVILTQGSKMILTPTYHVMKMYNVHQDALMIPITIKTTNYQLDNKKMTAVSSSASTKNGEVNISLTNVDYSHSQSVNINLTGIPLNNISATILNSSKITDHNTFDEPNIISPKAFTDFKKNGEQISVNLPAHSVVVINIKK